MHVYRIIQMYDDKDVRNLIISDGKSIPHRVSLFKNRNIDAFKIGKKMIVLRDYYLDMEDVAYICRGGLYLCQRPYLLEQYGCKDFIEYVAGMRGEYKLDRFILKRAIAHRCAENGIAVSKKSNINLLKLISSAKGY